ncbi:uncharacterized protein C2orf81 homolog [Haemorhous mexicanus]|uniref:uncharacterized protein C2orf81 homolog n=1 Tax=Haemorhous mexicanus TaxID=30427 RepID=UPI0028BF1154|nr:uncharacterized protein C2orf81 homolog [Haemorhous mexicanus]
MYWDELRGPARVGWEVLGYTGMYWTILGSHAKVSWKVLGYTGVYWDELRSHAGLRGGVLVHTGTHWAAPTGAAGAVGVSIPEQKGKSRGAGTRSKQDKPRAQPRQSKKESPRSSGRTSIQPSPSPDAEPQEPLDVEPILDELLERVLIESALAAVARQRVPFAVSRARDAILFVAEWRFLVRDDTDPDPKGDPDPERDGVWKEDEEPPAGLWDSWTPGAVAVAEAFSSSEELSSEDVSVAAEAESPPVSPGEAPSAAPAPGVPRPRGQVPSGALPVTAKGLLSPLAAAPALGVPRPRGQSRSAAAAAPPAQLPGPRPPRPKPPSAPQPRERGRSPTRAPGRGRPPSRAPGKGRQPSRHPQPPAAPAEAPRPPVPPPAAPSEPAAPAAPETREGAGKVGDREPPTPSSSSSSVASIQPCKPSHSAGVPRLRVRRGAARWVLPEVKVLDVSTESERPRLGASRTRMPLPGSHVQVVPGTARAARVEPQLCDPWLASVRLAPGVTVRWGGCERRGPALAGHGGDELGDEALRRAEKDLKPILPYPECRLAEYGESEEWQDDLLETELPGLPLPAPWPALGGSVSPRVSPVQWLAPGVALSDAPGDRGSLSSQK